jgi:membrane protein
LTYYSLLSLFPALLVLVALVGLFGQYPETTDAIFKMIRSIGPESAVDTFKHPVESVVRQKGGAGALLGVGLLGALWSASGYLGAFIRASNVIYGTDEGRPFWKLRPLQIVLTVALVLLTAVVALSLVASGSIAEAVGEGIGLGSTALTVWSIAKWPVLAAIVLLIIGILYRVAPNVRLPSWRWLSPGAVLAIVVWIVASAGFAIYVSRLGSYNSTYGSLGAVIIFLIWLWLTNLSILLGAEFNAELERERELAAGQPAEDELQLEPKDTRRKSYSGSTSR